MNQLTDPENQASNQPANGTKWAATGAATFIGTALTLIVNIVFPEGSDPVIRNGLLGLIPGLTLAIDAGMKRAQNKRAEIKNKQEKNIEKETLTNQYELAIQKLDEYIKTETDEQRIKQFKDKRTKLQLANISVISGEISISTTSNRNQDEAVL